jgi:hypothetical protein
MDKIDRLTGQKAENHGNPGKVISPTCPTYNKGARQRAGPVNSRALSGGIDFLYNLDEFIRGRM